MALASRLGLCSYVADTGTERVALTTALWRDVLLATAVGERADLAIAALDTVLGANQRGLLRPGA